MACLLAVAVGGSAQDQGPKGPPTPPTRVTDAALIAAAKLRGTIVATARADLGGTDPLLLVALQGRDEVVSFLLLAFGADAGGGITVLGRDEVRNGRLHGAPLLSISAGERGVAPDVFEVAVGWKGTDGSSEAQTLIYRRSGGRLVRLLQVEPDLAYAAGSGRPSLRHAIDLLPTSTATYRDLRVRTLECPQDGECSPVEVSSLIFDGSHYAERPYAVPFVEKAQASSQLASSGALVDYSAGAAVDGRLDTAWCEGAKGAGWFQKLELTFSPAERVKAISIVPGGPRGTPFDDWTRPKKVRVLLPDGRKVEADLADEPRAQRIALPEGERVFGMTVVITDVVKGKREDACIAELELEVEP